MKKMKTLFERKFLEHKCVECTRTVQNGCEWVLEGKGYATEKLDGTCCLIMDGKIYRRFDYKKGRELPKGAIPCQESADEITGHFPHWVLCDKDNPNDKYHMSAFNKKQEWENGTYELIGEHFQGNPYKIDGDVLEKHGQRILDVTPSFDGIKEFLTNNNIEGLVFYNGKGEMCKIKRTDFGLEWNNRKTKH